MGIAKVSLQIGLPESRRLRRDVAHDRTAAQSAACLCRTAAIPELCGQAAATDDIRMSKFVASFYQKQEFC